MLPAIVHSSGQLSTPSYPSGNTLRKTSKKKTGELREVEAVMVGRGREDDTLAGRIRIAMAARGIKSPSELARRMKINRQTVSKWTTGQGDKLTPEMLFSLSDVLDVNARWLAFGPPYSPTKPTNMNPETIEVLQIDAALRDANPESRESWLRSGRDLVRIVSPVSAGNPFPTRRK